MTRTEIKQAILDGKTVNWENGLYIVILKGIEGEKDLYVKCTSNNSITYLQQGEEAKCFLQPETDLFNRMGDIFRPEPAPEPLEPKFGQQTTCKHDTAWLETFYEVVAWIEAQLHPDHVAPCPIVTSRYEQQGKGGMYELAEELTERFERQHEGVKWGEDENYPDWFDYLECWLNGGTEQVGQTENGTIAPIDTDEAEISPKSGKGYTTDIPEPKFFYRDKSGRGFTATLTLTDIQDMPDEENEDGDEENTLHQWAAIAEIGDVFRPDAANEFTRIS